MMARERMTSARCTEGATGASLFKDRVVSRDTPIDIAKALR
jgi:hypothetical protein